MKPEQWIIVVAAIMHSVLDPIWMPGNDVQAHSGIRGWRQAVAFEDERRRSRSPHRRQGVKAMLLSWAKGEMHAVGICRHAYGIVKGDGSDCGQGMKRIAEMSIPTAVSEKTVQNDCAIYWLKQLCPN